VGRSALQSGLLQENAPICLLNIIPGQPFLEFAEPVAGIDFPVIDFRVGADGIALQAGAVVVWLTIV